MFIRRKRAVRLLIICLMCVTVMVAAGFADGRKKREVPIPCTDSVMGISVVEDTDFLGDREKLVCSQNPGVCYEEILLPFDQKGILYLSQSMEGDWTGWLSAAADDCFLCTPGDTYWERKQDAIKESHLFTLWMVGKDKYYEMQLVITGMPVISMETSYSREAEKNEDIDPDELDPDIRVFGQETMYYGTVSIFNPGVNTGKYEILQSYVRYHRKGASSYNFPKKGYSMCLQDYRGENVDASIFGMRMDNTWKLNALFNDPNRIREITASQIWERFDEADPSVKEPGPRMEYVELLLDGSYEGIYCLVESVDEEKLNLDRNDLLYKVVNWELPIDAEIQESVEKKWKMQYPIRIRYPEIIGDYQVAWFPMRDYLNTFYRGQILTFEEFASKIDIGNAADKQMFVMVVSGEDNYLKNTFFAARVDTPDRYVMYQIPWDLDLTFGRRYDDNARNFSYFDSNYTVEYREQVITSLKASDEEWAEEYLAERWKRYRKSFLSTESILNLLTENRDYLIDTGAVLREQERWPEEEIDMDIDYLLDYQTSRMEWLDWYFGG